MMRTDMRMKFLLSFIFLLSTFSIEALVTAPNYDFSLNKLDLFQPGSELREITKKFGNGKILDKMNDIQLIRYYLKELRYQFPVFIQAYNGKILDFYAPLPNYFLHDSFHQSLIKRYGQQNKYKNKENSSVYIWHNINGRQHIYRGSCTILCYPDYYSVITLKLPEKIQGFKSLLDKFKNKTPYDNEKLGIPRL